VSGNTAPGPEGSRLARLFAPRSIAVIGASPNPRRIGSRVLANVRRHGYGGRVHVVNPHHDEIDGLPVYRSLQNLPEIPDLALLAVDADTSLEVLATFAALGGRNAVLLASGFEGSSGKARMQRLTDLARTHLLNIVGPNSQGLWSVAHGMVLAFGSEAQRASPQAGPAAVLAASGSLGGAVTRQLLDRGVGVSYFVSMGDGAVLDTADYLEHVCRDPAVRVVALYLEGTRDGRRLGATLRDAGRRGVRVTTLLGGLSPDGRATARSHTGRIIAKPRLSAELLRQHGVVVAATVRELAATTRILALTPRALPQAPRTALLGISGGMLALLVDACAERLELAQFADGTQARLREVLPRYTNPVNPVDVTGAVVEDEALLIGALDAVLADPGVDALIAGLDNAGYDRVIRNAERFASTASYTRKPIVFSLWDPPPGRDAAVERQLGQAGVFIADDPAEAVAPLLWLTHRAPSETATGPATPPVLTKSDDLRTWPGISRLARALGARLPATCVLVAGQPVTFPPPGPPWVVKPMPNVIAHKTDRGLVHTHLHTAEQVVEAVSKVRAALGASVPVLVQQMVTGVEVLVAAGRDSDWGIVLTLGTGGSLVELLDEVTHLTIPSGDQEVRHAISRLPISRLLAGYRGTPPADVDAVVHVVMRLQDLVVAHADLIDEIELNPLVAGPAREGAFLVDVLVKAQESRAG
jgi:acetate---CoA ligase (ADP-forming)